MNTSLRYAAIAILLIWSGDLAAQWKLAAANVIVPIFRPYNGGGVITNHNGILWAGYHDVWMSKDTGKSWSKRTPFDGFNNSCIKDISFFDDNTGLATTQNGEIFITVDQGLSWTKHVPPNPFLPSIESGCFAGTRSDIIACSITGDLYVSHDAGASWQVQQIDSLASQVLAGSGGTAYLISGLSSGSHLWVTHDFGNTWVTRLGRFNPDSYSFARDHCDTTVFYVVNDDLAAREDNFSRIYISRDVGSTWMILDQNPLKFHCGSISAGPNAIFVQTYQGIRRSTDEGQTWKDIGGPPNLTDTRFVTALDNNVIVAVDSFGSVWVTPNSGGDSLSVLDGSGLAIVTADVSTDTVGGTVAVPISISGISSPQDFDVTLHYDPNLVYKGTYSPANVQLDMAGESWPGRSRIHLGAANSSGPLAYSAFEVYSDSLAKPVASYDSLSSLTAIVPCDNVILGSATSVITPPPGCEARILTHFIRDSSFPQLSIYPNPSNGSFQVISTKTLGEVTIAIYNMLGTKCCGMQMVIEGNVPQRIDLPGYEGVYAVRIKSVQSIYNLRVTLKR